MGVEILDGGTAVYTAPGASFGSDALLLARFARPKPMDRALDLCSGCGIVALVWHDEGHRGPCTALEIDSAARAARWRHSRRRSTDAPSSPCSRDGHRRCTV